MKAKTFLVFYVSFWILALAGIGLYQNMELPRWMEYLHIFFMVCIAGVGLYQGHLMLRARKLEQPADDELSIKILHRAAMISYLVSLNLWAVLIYISSQSEIEPGILFGTGIICMAAVFAISWMIIKVRGTRHA